MELNANHGLHLDTVTWRGFAMLDIDVKEYLNETKAIKYITNLSGQYITQIESHKMVIITYIDNTSKICYILKDR